MKKRIGAVCAVLGAIAVGGCGGSDGLSSIDACKQGNAKLCSLYFNCLSEADKRAFQSVIGLSSSDCQTKLNADCNQERTACGSGETYHEDKARACVDGFNAFTCADMSGTTITPPAACGQICTTS